MVKVVQLTSDYSKVALTAGKTAPVYLLLKVTPPLIKI